MAERLLEAHRAGQVRVAIGRASDYYGPARSTRPTSATEALLAT